MEDAQAIETLREAILAAYGADLDAGFRDAEVVKAERDAALSVVEAHLAAQQGHIYALETSLPENYMDALRAAEAERDALRNAVLDYVRSQVSRDAQWQRQAYGRIVALARSETPQ